MIERRWCIWLAKVFLEATEPHIEDQGLRAADHSLDYSVIIIFDPSQSEHALMPAVSVKL